MEDSLSTLYAKAQALVRDGEDDAAKVAFVEVLKRDPAHFGALTDLAGLAFATGHRSAARTAYNQAVETHPDNPKALVNLANLLHEDGDDVEAGNLYEAALGIDPAFPPAHQGLANVLAKLGDEAGAQHHRDLGFRGHSMVARPYRGTGTPPRVLLIVSAKGGNIPTNVILDDRLFATNALYAEYHDPAQPLPDHDVIFNAIGDADFCDDALDDVDAIARRSGAPLINPPDRVRITGREANAARLAHLPDIIVPRTQLLPRSIFESTNAAAELERQGFEFPLLLRSPGFHTGQHFARIDEAKGLREAVANLPGEELLAIEYLDARGKDGLARKYRVMFIDGQIYPLHLALSKSWKVHYFTSAMTEDPTFRREEERFLTEMPGAIGARALKGLEHLRDTLAFDYGGADFGLAPDGRLVLFEANATMAIVPPLPDPMWDYRRKFVDNAIEAARAMLRERAHSD